MENRIRILATGDTHGQIYPYTYDDQAPADCGLAKLNTLIKLLRDENTLVIDNGDFLYGSPLSFYHHQHDPEGIFPSSRVMKEMNYDYINLGNRDFDYGEDTLIRNLEYIDVPCITSNISYHGTSMGPTYVIREAAGKKIAIFGISTTITRYMEKRENIRHFKFQDAYETASKTVSLIRNLEKPDYVIGVYHGGFERDLTTTYLLGADNGENQGYAMMRDILGLDVLITGHQHRSLNGTAFRTAYTQAAPNGAQLACIDIFTDTGVIETRLLDADMPADPEVLECVQEEEDACQAWLDTPLGKSVNDLWIDNRFDARLHKSQVVTFLNQVQLNASDAQLSAAALTNGALGFPRDITMRSILANYPHPNTLVVKKLTGAVLREYLEKCAEYWSIRNDTVIISPVFTSPTQRHHLYDMVDGIEYTIKVSNEIGNRVIELNYNGQPVTDDMEFDVCFNSERALGIGGFHMIRTAPTVKEITVNIAELIAEYVQKKEIIDFEPVNNITVIR